MKHSVRITLILVAMFFVAQLLGLLIIGNYIDISGSQESGEVQHGGLPYQLEPPDVDKDFSYAYVLVGVLLGTGLIFMLMKYSLTFVWKIWYFLAIFFALLVGFAAFIDERYALLLAFVFAGFKVFKPSILVHNFTELFVYGGLAAFFVWIFNVKSAVILLVLISLYDMYAVWKSKHMIKLAKFQADSNVFAGLLIPYKLGKFVKPKGKVKVVKKKVKTAILGGGDIAFPLIFAGTVLEGLVLTMSFTEALTKVVVIPVMATVALSLLFYYSKEKKFYPAMPFISVGCFVGYGLMLLI